MAPKVYLITGANRGIGFALVNEIVANNAEVSIFAGVRNPSTVTSLEELSKKHPGKITTVKYVSADEEGNKALAKEIEIKHGHLDVVIACAGIATYMGSALDTPASELRDHLNVNVAGILVLFQSVYSLLTASTASPRLTAFISLSAGYTCYGASKVAVNYIARKIHFENDWIICFPLAPGIVDTDMSRSNRVMDTTGTLAPIQDALAISADKAATLLLGIIENSTREKDGGEFINVDGQKLTW
ncbi:NAD(P)-binding protein [Armillaria novae-zelandiae]|uniref:NAD(P)-binding protein n=1 Tax=Armillaria novae-zelandiae TaxID=153914 RepID=A0AA39U9X5_9AGAR|nr:NAD(P)-binding protein [Armillaria novae-zelandiae]